MKGMGVLLVILLFALFSGSSAQQQFNNLERTGGYARILSLGLNKYIEDPYFITSNPAWGAKYDNFVLGDLGTSFGSDFEAGGVGEFIFANLRASKNFSFGAFLTRKDFQGQGIAKLDAFNLVGETNSALGASLPPLDNNVELIGVYTSNGHSIGIGIAYASSTFEDKPAAGGATNGNAKQLGINVGYLGKLTNNIVIDLAGYIIFPGTTFETPQSSQTSFSQTVLSVNARGFIKTSHNVSVVPVVSLLTSKGTADIGDQNGVTTTDLPSYSAINIGVGINYRLGKFLLAGGPSFDILFETTPSVSGVSPKLTRTTTSFPHWNIGAEWQMLDWLVGRIGYNVATSKVTTETPASVTSKNEIINTSYSPINGGITLGVGFRFGGFSLDATVNEDVLRQGFNNLGGGGSTFSYLTMSYAF